MATRIYLVSSVMEPARLVEASTQAEAIRHVARKYRADVATTRQVADLITSGVKVEVAGEGE